MKLSDEKLKVFGIYLSDLCSQMRITYYEVCTEQGISRSTFSAVWKGRKVSIEHYLRVYHYLWNEADERIKRRMDEKLLELFHIEKES